MTSIDQYIRGFEAVKMFSDGFYRASATKGLKALKKIKELNLEKENSK